MVYVLKHTAADFERLSDHVQLAFSLATRFSLYNDCYF